METHGSAPYQHFFPVATFGIGNSGFVTHQSLLFRGLMCLCVRIPETTALGCVKCLGIYVSHCIR